MSIETLSTASISDAGQGDVLLSRRGGLETFLIGTAPSGTLMAIALDGERPFDAAPNEDWGSRSGLLIRRPRIVVDVESSRTIDELPLGSLHLNGNALRIAVKGNFGHAFVLVHGSGVETTKEAVVFTRWKIVAEDARGNTEDLFCSTPS